MKQKKKDKILANYKKDNFTVGKLKALIKDLDDDLLIGTIGHFGEFYGIDMHNIYLSRSYITDYYDGWRNEANRIPINVLQIISHDIGPDPD